MRAVIVRFEHRSALRRRPYYQVLVLTQFGHGAVGTVTFTIQIWSDGAPTASATMRQPKPVIIGHIPDPLPGALGPHVRAE